jgi:hypothetical protein
VRKANLHAEITIRPFADSDAPPVRELFIATNRLLSPPDLRDAFEAYIERSLAEEIDRIAAYYREHDRPRTGPADAAPAQIRGVAGGSPR